MKGLSPDEALAKWCPRKKVMADKASLLYCLRGWHRPVTVGRNGVTIKPRGKSISYGQFDRQVAMYKGTRKKVRVSYDPNDLRAIRVWEMDGRYVGELSMNQLGGMAATDKIGRKQIGELIRQQRRYKEAKRYVAKNRHHEYLTSGEILVMGLTDEPKKTQQPRPLKIQTTPLDGQSKQVEADQLRQAAGGEHDAKSRGLVDICEFMGDISSDLNKQDEDEYIDPFFALSKWYPGDPLDGMEPPADEDRFSIISGSKGGGA